MTERTAPKLHKAPFLIGDALLLGVAAWLVLHPGPPLDLWHHALVAACVALGAWLGVAPFQSEFNAAVQLAEAEGLATTVEQISQLKTVGDQIAAATARWQVVQEAADKTAKSAKDVADQIAAEARTFAETMQKMHDVEVRNLRLEVEKSHRAEGEWLQVAVRTLDHVHALHAAGVRSGQAPLMEQLGRFQNACRDVARRVGLAVLAPSPGEPFDRQVHQLAEGKPAAEGGEIAEVLAPGYTFQGQLLRRPLVTLRSAPPPAAPPDAALACVPETQLGLGTTDQEAGPGASAS
jgi:molecular chaperone GrpE (heat shock protein)